MAGSSRSSRGCPPDARLPPLRWLAVARSWSCVPPWSGGRGLAGPAGAAPSRRRRGRAAADPGTEAQFVSRINSLRASKGLPPAPGVRRARRRGPALDRPDGRPTGRSPTTRTSARRSSGDWTKLGENVGVGYDVDGLMQAFINSPAHYANLVDPAWTHVGVGVTIGGDGRMYTTHNFMALGGGAAAAAAAAARRRRAAPAPTAPPTTAPRPPPPPTTTAAPAAARAAPHRGPRHRGARPAAIARTGVRPVRRDCAPMTAAIETQDLTRSFPSGVALDGLTLEVQPGEVLALLGPERRRQDHHRAPAQRHPRARPRARPRCSGSTRPSTATSVRRRTGVLTEHAGLDERLTARENLVAHRPACAGLDRRVRRSAAPTSCSSGSAWPTAPTSRCRAPRPGQRKRLALARALLHDPDVLFLDEPTSGLDPAATRDVIDLIGSLATEHGRTVVLCTHFLGEAGRLANRMAVLAPRACCTPSAGPSEHRRRAVARASTPSSSSAARSTPRPPTRCAPSRGVSMVAPTPDGRARARGRPRASCPHLVRLLVERGRARLRRQRQGADARGRVLRRRGAHRGRRGPRRRPPPTRSSRREVTPMSWTGDAGDHRQGRHRGPPVEGRS